MKFILSLLLMPSVMGDFQKLTDMSTMGKCSKINSVKDKYLLLYTVPYSDSEADVEKFLLYPDETPLQFPANSIIISQNISQTAEWKTCLKDGSDVNLPEMTGKVYFVGADYIDTTVHQWKDEDYPVEASSRYIVIFSNDPKGSTLNNFKRDDSTSFVVYSGLPGDAESAVLYAEEDAELRVDEIYLPDDHFYIDNQGGKLQFDVLKGGTPATKQTFKTNGFILSPGFPNPPDNDNKKANISIVKIEVDRKITLQVTAATIEGKQDARMIQLASATKSGVHVTVGDNNIFIPPGSAGSITTDLPGNAEQFQISSDVAYAVQFNIDDAPVTSTTTSTTSTTAKAGASTTTTAGASVNSAATPATCPPVTQCSCLSSTTETPTTTQSATMSSIVSTVTVFFTYQLL